MSSIHPTETANCGDRADSISPVDKATDNNSDVIKTAAECMPNNRYTCQAWEQASQSTGDAAGAATGPGDRPPLASIGRPKHSHRRPIRFLDSVAASSPPTGRIEPQYCIVSHVGCRLVFTCVCSRTVFELIRTSSVTNFTVNNATMP